MTTERTEHEIRSTLNHVAACALSAIALAPLAILLIDGRSEALFALALFSWLAIDLFVEPERALPSEWWKAMPMAAPGLAMAILAGAMLLGYRIDMSSVALVGATVFAAVGISTAYRIYRGPSAD